MRQVRGVFVCFIPNELRERNGHVNARSQMQIPRPANTLYKCSCMDRLCFLFVINTPRHSKAGATNKSATHPCERSVVRGPYGIAKCMCSCLLSVNCLATIAYLSFAIFVVVVLVLFKRIEFLFLYLNKKATNNNCIIRSNTHTHIHDTRNGAGKVKE